MCKIILIRSFNAFLALLFYHDENLSETGKISIYSTSNKLPFFPKISRCSISQTELHYRVFLSSMDLVIHKLDGYKHKIKLPITQDCVQNRATTWNILQSGSLCWDFFLKYHFRFTQGRWQRIPTIFQNFAAVKEKLL